MIEKKDELTVAQNFLIILKDFHKNNKNEFDTQKLAKIYSNVKKIEEGNLGENEKKYLKELQDFTFQSSSFKNFYNDRLVEDINIELEKITKIEMLIEKNIKTLIDIGNRINNNQIKEVANKAIKDKDNFKTYDDLQNANKNYAELIKKFTNYENEINITKNYLQQLDTYLDNDPFTENAVEISDIIEKLKTIIEENDFYNNISSINVDTASFINKNNIRPPTFIEKNNISIEKINIKKYAQANLNYRKDPTPYSSILGTINKGSQVQVIGKLKYGNQDWFEIKINNNLIAYSSAKYLLDNPPKKVKYEKVKNESKTIDNKNAINKILKGPYKFYTDGSCTGKDCVDAATFKKVCSKLESISYRVAKDWRFDPYNRDDIGAVKFKSSTWNSNKNTCEMDLIISTTYKGNSIYKTARWCKVTKIGDLDDKPGSTYAIDMFSHTCSIR